MKNLRPILLITLFIFWLVVGFLVADRLMPIFFAQLVPSTLQTTQQPTNTPEPAFVIKQGTLLLVHVDNLANSSPSLLSIWAVFVSLSDQPSLIIKSIYSPLVAQNDPLQLDKTFSLTSQGELSSPFLDSLKELDFHWDNYILYDDQALSAITNWISGNDPAGTPTEGIETGQSNSPYESEKFAFEMICSHLAESENERGEKPAWQGMIPTHMHSDLLFDDTMANWERITLATPLPHCEVLTEP